MPDSRIDLPAYGLRTLHSGWIDFLDSLGQSEVRDAFIRRADGVDFQRWVLALMRGVYCISVRIDEDDVILGLALPVSDGPDRLLYEMEPTHNGLRPEYLLALAMVDVDEEIEELLGTER